MDGACVIFPLPEKKAWRHCRELMHILDTEKRIDFSVPAEKAEARFSTDSLFSSGKGQMFGVCVCLDSSGQEVVLRAFSGQYNSSWCADGWVPPALDPEQFSAATAESDRRIHELTDEIAGTECARKRGELAAVRKKLSRKSMKEIFALYRIHCVQRVSAPWKASCAKDADGVPPVFRKDEYTFEDIFGAEKMPPTGTGECCAPKLLNYAALHGLRPVSLAEFYYGPATPSGSRIHGQLYPPCDEKCAPLMPFLLGLDIVYRDDCIVVVNKPSGLLSVPGRTPEKQDCVVSRLKFLFPGCIEQPAVHRLDMDTSGLMVLALTQSAHTAISRQFMERTVVKKYQAVLSRPIRIKNELTPAADDMQKNDGAEPFGCTVTQRDAAGNPLAGRIMLPFRLDVDRRPLQIFDPIHGKTGITDWRQIGTQNGGENPVIEFTPHTGRTHQLRLHASHENGLNAPIAGDNLYGGGCKTNLMLHACRLEFSHPQTGQRMIFCSPRAWNADTAE